MPIKKERDLIASQAQVPRSTLQKNAPSRADRARWLVSSGRVVVKFAVLSLTLFSLCLSQKQLLFCVYFFVLGKTGGWCEKFVRWRIEVAVFSLNPSSAFFD